MNRKLTLKKRGKSDALVEEAIPTDSIVTVGKNPGSTIHLDGKNIAPEQFVMLAEGEEFVLMNHADGTIYNGDELLPGARVAMNEGDRVEVGSYELFYGAPPEAVTSGEPAFRSAAKGSHNSAAGIAAAKVAEIDAGISNEKAPEKIAAAESAASEESDFSKLLYDLREEDTFYFHVHDQEGSIERVPFKTDEIWLGTKLGNVAVESIEENIDEVFARVLKDWSGVVLYPRDDQKLLHNGDRLLEPTRLSNEDTLVFIDDFEDAELETTITFHEPVALMALNSILPGDLPEPISSDSAGVGQPLGEQARGADAGTGAALADTGNRLIFGYFSLIEVLIMAVGTVVTAAIIFFVLEFV